MSLINPDERTIRIHPPIPWADIQTGPDLVALAMLFNIPEDADPLDPDERWSATAITTAAGADWSPSYLERQLQKVVDHYGGREYSGHIEVRSTNGEGTAAWRIVVRGKHVVRLAAVLGWPPEQADGPGEDGLMEILADHNVHIGDERFIPADQTDLPDVLLAWRDAAVRAAAAELGMQISQLETALADVTRANGHHRRVLDHVAAKRDLAEKVLDAYESDSVSADVALAQIRSVFETGPVKTLTELGLKLVDGGKS